MVIITEEKNIKRLKIKRCRKCNNLYVPGHLFLCFNCGGEKIIFKRKKKQNKSKKNYYKLFPKKIKVRMKTQKAIKDGILIRPDKCQNCNKKCKPDAHHNDYSKPLEIEWLCRQCHYWRHTPGKT